MIPYSPGESVSKVWFLGDILTVLTHWGDRNTVPCIGDGCPLCSTPPKLNGYAPVLVHSGHNPEGDEVWTPRVLRVFPRNFAIGDNLRGRVYVIKKVSGPKIPGGKGGRNEWDYTFSYTKAPPIEAFSVEAVMNSVWFPSQYPPVHIGEFKLPTKVRPPAPSPQETTFEDSIRDTPTEQLVALLTAYHNAGIMPGMRAKIEAELLKRDVKTSLDLPEPIDLGEAKKRKPGTIASKDGTVYFEPAQIDEPDTLPINSKRRKGGAA